MTQMEREGEHPTGLTAIRALLLTGFRRMEVLGMRKAWLEQEGNCVAFPDTKSDPTPGASTLKRPQAPVGEIDGRFHSSPQIITE